MEFIKKMFGASGQPSEGVLKLMEDLRNDDPALRKAACDEAAELGPEAKPNTELLEELLQDDDGDVCMAAEAATSKVVRGF